MTLKYGDSLKRIVTLLSDLHRWAAYSICESSVLIHHGVYQKVGF